MAKYVRGRGGLRQLIRLVTFGLAVAAVVKELRQPPEDRTWHGEVAGLVPYDFRIPTLDRAKDRLWNPEGDLIGPHVFGVGWSVNVGRLVALARGRDDAA
jgi:hypothetical protein